MDQLFHNPGLNHIGQQILNLLNKEIKIQPKNISQTWTQIVDFVQSNEKTNLMYFYSNFGMNHIGRKIFMELNFEGIQALRGVCKTWKDIIDNYKFWQDWNEFRSKIQFRYEDEDFSSYVGDGISGYRFLDIVLESFKVFDFNLETRELTKNAISLFCIRYLIKKKRERGDWERNPDFYEYMWAKIAEKYLKMCKIYNLWAKLLQIHASKNVENLPNVLRLIATDFYWHYFTNDTVDWELMEVEFDPLDDQSKVLNNLTNFCLNPNLKHIGQKIFSYLKFKDQANSRQVCFSFKEAIDLMWAENVGISITRLYLRLFYNRNSARKLIKQIQTAQKNLHQITKKRSGSPINQISKRAKIVEEKASISWRPKDEQTLRWTSDITEGSKETKISGKFGQISWKQNGESELRWTQGLKKVGKRKHRKRPNKYRRQAKRQRYLEIYEFYHSNGFKYLDFDEI